MGLFDFLLGGKRQSNVEVVPDRIWMTTQAKFAGLAKEVAARSPSEAVAVLLVAHFPDVLARLEELADQHPANPPLKAVPASNLDTHLASTLNLDESANVDIIVGERHPLPSVDDRLEAFANELPCCCRLSHHLSLEDPILRIFAGEWVKDTLCKLGMTEEESIESQMVSRRIRQSQQKIERKVRSPVGAESAAQWLEKNCPELTKR